jgi:adenosylhomocysteine nucleosidase
VNNIVLIALQDEAPELIGHSNVFFTGVGKVNAAITAARLIEKHKPQRVINFGTAGGITVSHGLHQCTRFVQRDMNCEALGVAPGITPFDHMSSVAFADHGLVCASGDSFVNGQQLLVTADVVDMEAYAIAKVCAYYDIEFVCYKYISDSADSQAHVDWKQSVAQGQSAYIQKLQELNI